MTTPTAVPRPRPSSASEPAAEELGASVGGRVDVAPTPPATERPPLHELFARAGGDTPAYDPDAYLALLREHGWLGDRKPLTAILVDVLQACRESAADPETLAAAMAPVLTDELGKHGYRIHDVVRCVRPKDHPLTLGRPMTPEEEARLVIPASALPGDGHFEHVTPEGDRFLIPDGYTPGEKSSRCRSCDALILWSLTRNQKRAPVNPDGTSHFASCPQADQWRKEQA